MQLASKSGSSYKINSPLVAGGKWRAGGVLDSPHTSKEQLVHFMNMHSIYVPTINPKGANEKAFIEAVAVSNPNFSLLVDSVINDLDTVPLCNYASHHNSLEFSSCQINLPIP